LGVLVLAAMAVVATLLGAFVTAWLFVVAVCAVLVWLTVWFARRV
jgi:hypothetical protein